MEEETKMYFLFPKNNQVQNMIHSYSFMPLLFVPCSSMWGPHCDLLWSFKTNSHLSKTNCFASLTRSPCPWIKLSSSFHYLITIATLCAAAAHCKENSFQYPLVTLRQKKENFRKFSYISYVHIIKTYDVINTYYPLSIAKYLDIIFDNIFFLKNEIKIAFLQHVI